MNNHAEKLNSIHKYKINKYIRKDKIRLDIIVISGQ